MGIAEAFRDGKCANPTCQKPFKKGEKVCVEKGKPALCLKCAPEGAKETRNWGNGGAKQLDIRDTYALKAMEKMMERHEKLLARDMSKVVFEIVDAMMEERKKRGMK